MKQTPFGVINKKAWRLVLSCLFVFSMVGCVNDMNEVAAILEPAHLPVEEGDNISMIYTDSAKVKVRVEAPRLERYTGDDPYLEMPAGVHVRFYRSDGNVESELTADYAISYEKSNVMTAKKNVVLINTNGEKLNSEELNWSEKDHRIFTEEFVTITTEDEVIYGHGFESNEDFTKYKINKISGTIQIEDEKDVQDP